MSLACLIRFTQWLDSDAQLVFVCSIITTCMYLCLTVAKLVGRLCPFSGSSKWNICWHSPVLCCTNGLVL